MTYPQYPQQPGYQQMPPAPQFPAPQFPPQQQFPAAPVPQYQQQYAQQPAYPSMMPPAEPLPVGSLDDFFNQPSVGGGPSLSWTNKDMSQKPIGTTYVGIVERPLSSSDVQAQTQQGTNQVARYRDGRPKYVMIVPLIVNPSQEHPEGRAQWYVRGQARDELTRAMAEAGAPTGAPEAGAGIQITLVGRRPSGQGRQPANQFQIRYTRPAGAPAVAPAAAPAPEQVQQPVAQAAPQQQPQYAVQQPPPVAQPVQQQWAPPQYAPPQYAPPQAPAGATNTSVAAAPLSPQAQQITDNVAAIQQQQAPAPQAAPMAAPDGLSPEQQQLLATLTAGK